jgi:hypothetical protein
MNKNLDPQHWFCPQFIVSLQDNKSSILYIKTSKIIFTFQANCLRHTATGQAGGAVVGWSCRSREYRLQKQ